MAMTHEEAQTMLNNRFREHPELAAIAASESFLKTLEEILTFHAIGSEWLEVVAKEVRIVLALYAPLDELGGNLAISVGLTADKAGALAKMIELMLLEPVHDDLIAYNYLWAEQEGRDLNLPPAESSLKEKLELRPEGVPAGEQMTQPLTREELLNALSSKRTMASDMARVQGAPATGSPTVGYQNYKPPTESTPGQ